jgi:hypothetical protein
MAGKSHVPVDHGGGVKVTKEGVPLPCYQVAYMM